MKLVIQRVKKAKVEVEEKVVGEIEKGFLVLVGITHTDTKQEADYLAKKLCNLRVFEDENQKMNKNIKDVNGKLLIVSQFTLIAKMVTDHHLQMLLSQIWQMNYMNIFAKNVKRIIKLRYKEEYLEQICRLVWSMMDQLLL